MCTCVRACTCVCVCMAALFACAFVCMSALRVCAQVLKMCAYAFMRLCRCSSVCLQKCMTASGHAHAPKHALLRARACTIACAHVCACVLAYMPAACLPACLPAYVRVRVDMQVPMQCKCKCTRMRVDVCSYASTSFGRHLFVVTSCWAFIKQGHCFGEREQPLLELQHTASACGGCASFAGFAQLLSKCACFWLYTS